MKIILHGTVQEKLTSLVFSDFILSTGRDPIVHQLESNRTQNVT